MKPSDQVVDRKDSQGFARYLAQNGQLLLPLVELLETSRMALDELIDVLVQAGIEAVLHLSAAGMAGEKHQGRKDGGIIWHSTQEGKVFFSDRKLRVKKPQLRRKGWGAGPGGAGTSSSRHLRNQPKMLLPFPWPTSLLCAKSSSKGAAVSG